MKLFFSGIFLKYMCCNPTRGKLVNISLLFVIILYSFVLSKSIFEYSPIPQILFGHDFIGFLDGVIKLSSGQKSNVDFYNPLGPAFLGTLVFTYKISGDNLLFAVPVANFIISLVVAVLAFCFSIKKFSFFQSLIFCNLIFLVIQSPFQIYLPPTQYSYACIYNRWGSALICVLFCACLVRRNDDIGRIDYFVDIICALISAWLLLLKISYGMCAIAIIIAMFFKQASPWNRRLIAVTRFLFLTFCFLLFFGEAYDLGMRDYLYDLKIAAAARVPMTIAAFKQSVLMLAERNVVDGTLYLLAICLVFFIYARTKYIREIFIISIVILISSLWADWTNSPIISKADRETPILSAGILLLCFLVYNIEISSSIKIPKNILNKNHLSIHSSQYFLLKILFIMLALLIVFPIYLKSFSFLNSLETNVSILKSDEARKIFTFHSGYLKGLVIYGFGGDPPLSTTYVGKVYDGLSLLKKNNLETTPILSIDFTNPLNIVRGIVSPKGSPQFLQYGFSFSASSVPDEERLFNDCKALMIAKHFGDGHFLSTSTLLDSYKDYLGKCFRYMDESSEWILMVRKCE